MGAFAVKDTAEQDGSALTRDNPLERVDRLAWLAPSATSLAALARFPSPYAWTVIRDDPAAVLLVLRQPGDSLAARLDSPTLFDTILRHLDDGPSFDWNREPLRSVYRAGHACASLARQLAGRLRGVDQEKAWCCGLLAPLGRYVDCAADPAVVARRLARRWELPAWLTAVCGHLDLPPQAAAALGADAVLFHLTRLVVSMMAERGFAIDASSSDRAADIAVLDLAGEDVDRVVTPDGPKQEWTDPRCTPLLHELLTVAAENRRLRDGQLRRRAETEVDRLHTALIHEVQDNERQLEARKLAALAEFAAGAGHEINNPLAVISGQAQHLQRQLQKLALRDMPVESVHRWEGEAPAEPGTAARPEPRPPCVPAGVAADFGSSLQTIINQTKRIHGLLRDLMHFAKPPKPRPVWVTLNDLIVSAARELQDLVTVRRVRLEMPADSADPIRLHVDPQQIRLALLALMRNAVEAAPAEGWARVTVHGPAAEQIVVVVEDSGAGPDRAQVPHLFDPFYSGRDAGRGRGLGLSCAWRLARLHGGDVRFVATETGQPTRFVLELPWVPPPAEVPGPVVSTSDFCSPNADGIPLTSCHTT
jgi:signal transduction histidine kinase